MPSIDITHDLGKLSIRLDRAMSAGNMNFALAKTLTNLAIESRDAVKQEMTEHFTIRRPWVVKGIRAKGATKSNLTAYVWSQDSGGRRDFMGRQETGGLKTPMGGGHIAIPMKAVKPTERSLVPQVMKPKALLGRPVVIQGKTRIRVISSSSYKALLIDSKKPGHQIILIKRGGKYAPAWHLAPHARIDDTHFLTGPASTLIARRAMVLLGANIREALSKR